MSRRAGSRRFSSEPFQVGEPDLDERANRVLQPGLPRKFERLLVALSHLGRIDALLEPVVPGDQELLDSLARVALHRASLTTYFPPKRTGVILMEAASTMPSPIRVVIADDHRLFAEALEAILATDERIEVAGHAGDGREAVELAMALNPDVILMDISMPVMDGLEATRLIRKGKPKACVLMLTGSNSRADVDNARQAGAAGYVTKDRIAAELINAIMEVAG